MEQNLICNAERMSFADLLDDNLSQILLVVETMKYNSWKGKDEKSIEQLEVISKRISKLYDARLELAENMTMLQS